MEFKLLLLIYPITFLVIGFVLNLFIFKGKNYPWFILFNLAASIILIGFSFSFQIDALWYSFIYAILSLIGALISKISFGGKWGRDSGNNK
ncbi:hypothetical protein ACTHO0_23915 [Cytobacillus praedii]|uniref:hypothetical protein n=1 Tax=Cytobacillus praedii TaxID=1742358 RepID=UPI003F7EB7BF